MQGDHSKHRKDWYRCGAESESEGSATSPPFAAGPEDSEASLHRPAAASPSEEFPPHAAGPQGHEAETPVHGAEAYWHAVEEDTRCRHKKRSLALIITGVVLCIAAVFALQDWGYVLSGGSPVVKGSSDGNSVVPGPYDSIDEFFENYYTDVSGQNSLDRVTVREGFHIQLTAPSGQQLSLQEIYEKVAPCVVGLSTYSKTGSAAWGTGLVISEDGYILTNDHIIDGKDSAVVSFSDGTELEASLAAHDSQSDLALLKVEASGLPYAEFGDSSLLNPGDEVVAIGNPLGVDLSGTMTDGIISAISREVPYQGHRMTLLQTNAAINEGNSGGPLINMYGQVIGITNMKMVSLSDSAAIEGIGFAIPSSVVQDIMGQLLQHGYISGRPTVGVTGGAIPRDVARYYGLPQGIYVSAVVKGSGADQAGVEPGDLITYVEGEAVTTIDQLNAIKDQLQVGDTLTMTLYRNGKSREVTVVLSEEPAE